MPRVAPEVAPELAMKLLLKIALKIALKFTLKFGLKFALKFEIKNRLKCLDIRKISCNFATLLGALRRLGRVNCLKISDVGGGAMCVKQILLLIKKKQ